MTVRLFEPTGLGHRKAICSRLDLASLQALGTTREMVDFLSLGPFLAESFAHCIEHASVRAVMGVIMCTLPSFKPLMPLVHE